MGRLRPRSRRRLLGDIGHDLKSLLTPVCAGVELLQWNVNELFGGMGRALSLLIITMRSAICCRLRVVPAAALCVEMRAEVLFCNESTGLAKDGAQGTGI